MAKQKETEFDKLARLIKSESDDIRKHMATKEEMVAGFAAIRKEMATKEDLHVLEKKVDEGFSVIIRRLDTIIQIQLDQHAHRIKKLETAVFK